jgi:uncharacterized ion transporter superfamily protein YfcC
MKNKIDYNQLINQIEGKELEFIKVCMPSKLARKPQNIKFKKGAEKSILKYDLGKINAEIIIKKQPDNSIEIQYKKGIILAIIGGTMLILIMHYIKHRPYTELAFSFSILWIGLPFIINIQENYLSKKYTKRINKHFSTEV